MALSPDENYLAVGSDDHVIRIFDWKRLRLEQELLGHKGEVYSVAWSSDKTLASASEDKEIRLWNLNKPNDSKILSGHTEEVVSVSFSSDGRLLASQSSDMTLRFWNAVEATPVDFFEWECSVNPNVGMTFDSAQPLLISLGNKDHSFRVWKVDAEKLIEAANKRTDKDNQAWNRSERGFISTSLSNSSKQHKIARDACVEAGHTPILLQEYMPVNLQEESEADYAELKAKAIRLASTCDFYLGIFHIPEACIFAEAEIKCFLDRGKKVYFFFPEELDRKGEISDSKKEFYNDFKKSVSKTYHVYNYKNEDELTKEVLRVLKNRLSTKRDMIQNSEGGLYGNPL